MAGNDDDGESEEAKQHSSFSNNNNNNKNNNSTTKMDSSRSSSSSSSTTPTPTLFCAVGDKDANLSVTELEQRLHSFLESLGPKTNVLVLPPDYTRFHSQAGTITRLVHEYYRAKSSTPTGTTSTTTRMTVLPALGTHAPMTETQIRTMFGDDMADSRNFVVHDWRKDVVTIGHAPASMVEEATNGMVRDTPWPAQLNRLVWEGRHDLVLSVGQVVPHEVMGMANFNKNLFVGVGGVEAINLSHFIGAVYGMERMMGRTDNPLRRILNYASTEFLQTKLPLWYVLTVVGTSSSSTNNDLEVKGFYIGRDIECYQLACELSLQVNFSMLDTPLAKVVVYLDPDEFHSTWLGNKAIYRTRMAIADGGELVVLAPGVRRFGEDDAVDRLIRRHGYRGTPATLRARDEDEDMRHNLSAVAHLIHGSTEGRFRVVYCTDPDLLSRQEVEGVGFAYADLADTVRRYKSQDGGAPTDGPNTTPQGEDFYYIRNPALGLWAVRSRFEGTDSNTTTTSTTTTESKDVHKGKANDVLDEPQNASDHSGGVGGWKKPPPPI